MIMQQQDVPSPAPHQTSVIIPCHNYGRYLSWCIESVLHQTRSAGEIIVVDDASDDDTEAVARSFGDRIRYFRVGFRNAQKTRNFGFEKATHDYVLYLDADDFLDNDALYLMEAEMAANPKLRLVYCDRIHVGDPALTIQLGPDNHWRTQEFSIEKLHQTNFISMPSLLRRSTFAGFDERIRLNQDWDAWLGTLQDDAHAKRIARPLFYYRFHGKNKTVQENEFTERFKIMVKHGLIRTLTAGDEGRPTPANRSSRAYIAIHSVSNADASTLTSALSKLRNCNAEINLLGAASDAQTEAALEQSGLHIKRTPAVSTEAFLRRFLPTAVRYMQHDDIFVISDLTSLLDFAAPSALYQTEDAATYTPEGADRILQMRAFEELGFLAMNGKALRHLLYIYEKPNDRLRRLQLKAEEFLAKHVLWRLASRHH